MLQSLLFNIKPTQDSQKHKQEITNRISRKLTMLRGKMKNLSFKICKKISVLVLVKSKKCQYSSSRRIFAIVYAIFMINFYFSIQQVHHCQASINNNSNLILNGDKNLNDKKVKLFATSSPPQADSFQDKLIKINHESSIQRYLERRNFGKRITTSNNNDSLLSRTIRQLQSLNNPTNNNNNNSNNDTLNMINDNGHKAEITNQKDYETTKLNHNNNTYEYNSTILVDNNDQRIGKQLKSLSVDNLRSQTVASKRDSLITNLFKFRPQLRPNPLIESLVKLTTTNPYRNVHKLTLTTNNTAGLVHNEPESYSNYTYVPLVVPSMLTGKVNDSSGVYYNGANNHNAFQHWWNSTASPSNEEPMQDESLRFITVNQEGFLNNNNTTSTGDSSLVDQSTKKDYQIINLSSPIESSNLQQTSNQTIFIDQNSFQNPEVYNLQPQMAASDIQQVIKVVSNEIEDKENSEQKDKQYKAKEKQYGFEQNNKNGEHIRDFEEYKKWKKQREGEEQKMGSGSKDAKKDLKWLKDMGHNKHGWKNVYHKEEYAQHQKFHDVLHDKDWNNSKAKMNENYHFNKGNKFDDTQSKSSYDKDKHKTKYDYVKGNEWKRQEDSDHSDSDEQHQSASEGDDSGENKYKHPGHIHEVGASNIHQQRQQQQQHQERSLERPLSQATERAYNNNEVNNNFTYGQPIATTGKNVYMSDEQTTNNIDEQPSTDYQDDDDQSDDAIMEGIQNRLNKFSEQHLPQQAQENHHHDRGYNIMSSSTNDDVPEKRLPLNNREMTGSSVSNNNNNIENQKTNKINRKQLQSINDILKIARKVNNNNDRRRLNITPTTNTSNLINSNEQLINNSNSLQSNGGSSGSVGDDDEDDDSDDNDVSPESKLQLPLEQDKVDSSGKAENRKNELRLKLELDLGKSINQKVKTKKNFTSSPTIQTTSFDGYNNKVNNLTAAWRPTDDKLSTKTRTNKNLFLSNSNGIQNQLPDIVTNQKQDQNNNYKQSYNYNNSQSLTRLHYPNTNRKSQLIPMTDNNYDYNNQMKKSFTKQKNTSLNNENNNNGFKPILRDHNYQTSFKALANSMPNRPIYVKHLQMNGGVVLGRMSNKSLVPSENKLQKAYFNDGNENYNIETTLNNALSDSDTQLVNNFHGQLNIPEDELQILPDLPIAKENRPTSNNNKEFMLVFGGIEGPLSKGNVDKEHSTAETFQAHHSELPNEPNVIFEAAASNIDDQRRPYKYNDHSMIHSLEDNRDKFYQHYDNRLNAKETSSLQKEIDSLGSELIRIATSPFSQHVVNPVVESPPSYITFPQHRPQHQQQFVYSNNQQAPPITPSGSVIDFNRDTNNKYNSLIKFANTINQHHHQSTPFIKSNPNKQLTTPNYVDYYSSIKQSPSFIATAAATTMQSALEKLFRLPKVLSQQLTYVGQQQQHQQQQQQQSNQIQTSDLRPIISKSLFRVFHENIQNVKPLTNFNGLMPNHQTPFNPFANGVADNIHNNNINIPIKSNKKKKTSYQNQLPDSIEFMETSASMNRPMLIIHPTKSIAQPKKNSPQNVDNKKSFATQYNPNHDHRIKQLQLQQRWKPIPKPLTQKTHIVKDKYSNGTKISYNNTKLTNQGTRKLTKKSNRANKLLHYMNKRMFL